LASACLANQPLYPHVLAAAAMLLIRQQKTVQMGDAIRDVVAEFYPRSPLPHLYLASPFLWGERLKALRGEVKNIAWLLAVPVTSSELTYLQSNGAAGLEEIYRLGRVDMFSLTRRTWMT
jgi:hypothetical protein